MALLMMTLPAVSLTMVSACKMGTPLLTSVPSVRVKREMATLLMTGPKRRHLELDLVPDITADFRFDGQQEHNHHHRHRSHRRQNVEPDGVADRQHKHGETRHLDPHAGEERALVRFRAYPLLAFRRLTSAGRQDRLAPGPSPPAGAPHACRRGRPPA